MEPLWQTIYVASRVKYSFSSKMFANPDTLQALFTHTTLVSDLLQLPSSILCPHRTRVLIRDRSAISTTL